MIKNLLKRSAKSTEPKVGLNFKLPISKKELFETVCNKHNISMTDMLLSIVDYIIEEDKGIEHTFNTESLLQINEDIKRLEKEISEYYLHSNHNSIPSAVVSGDKQELSDLYALENEKRRLELIFKFIKYELSIKN
ncbi:MAG: Unknown protein [uncultured Sulfurovum sp.]|uniref:Uncharacterized protein n=1 Tax=uncultured Sulfurovum sp. TaxID=269237 RepID=A0A6S6SG76_9BACT|nr:MAG: Unknown protein [uncultured Sulfurovum sp.]